MIIADKQLHKVKDQRVIGYSRTIINVNILFTNDNKSVTINMKQYYDNKHLQAFMKETTTENTYTAVIEKTDKWYIAYIEEIPGANAQGKTIDEAKENLKEAIQLIILSNRELAEREFRGKNIIREKIRVAL